MVFGDVSLAKEAEAKIAELDLCEGVFGLDNDKRKEREDTLNLQGDIILKEEVKW